MTLHTGRVLQNRYRIVAQLGQGGMGAVYRAWDTRLEISVALKEMVPQPGLDAQTLEGLRRQFQQEAQILARLNHPHLVRVGDFFEEGGKTYLVMDFVEGESLAAVIVRSGAQPESMVLKWADQLLDALTYCHNQGIIHRDIKPQNVIIRSDGRAVLVDFGLVKLWDPRDPSTRTAMRGMGTPEYAPPEQYDVASGHTDPRSDIYSLGATLYQALTGTAPPTATMRVANPADYRAPRRLNPNVSSRAEAVVVRATELAIDRRFATAKEMAMAFKGQIPMPVPTAPARGYAGAAPGYASGAREYAGGAPEYGGGAPEYAGTPATQVGARGRQAPSRKRAGAPAWLWGIGGLAGVVIVAGIVAVVLIGMGAGGLSLGLGGGDATLTMGAASADSTETPPATPSPERSPTSSPPPSATDVPEPSPLPTRTPAPEHSPTVEEIAPTDTPEPTNTPVPPTPTSSAPPTTPPPTLTPTDEPSPTPPPSEGPLDFPEPTQLDGYENVEGGRRCLIVVRISGGAPPFQIQHDSFQDTSNEREYLLYFIEGGCTIVHTIRVDSADGQSLSRQYYISSPWCN